MDNGCLIEVDITVPPPVEVDITVPAPVDVVVTPVPPIEVQIEQILVGVDITPPAPVEVVISCVGQQGPPGPPGADGGGSGNVEIYTQPIQPAEGAFAWYWFETDGAGNLTGNEYVYDPDGI